MRASPPLFVAFLSLAIVGAGCISPAKEEPAVRIAPIPAPPPSSEPVIPPEAKNVPLPTKNPSK